MRINWAEHSTEIRVAGKSRWRTGVRISPTWQQWVLDYDLWVVSSGKGKIHLQQGIEKLARGTILWMRPGKRYLVEQTPSEPLEMYYVHFHLIKNGQPVFPADDQMPPEIINGIPAAYSLQVADRIFSFGEDSVVFRADQRRVASALLQSLLMDLDVFTTDIKPQITTSGRDHLAMRFLDLRRRIEADIANVPSVKEMAREMNYSVPHFNRLFLKYTQIVPVRLIQRTRVAKAQQLLAETELPMKRIAQMLGYSNCQYFCRQFKKFAKMSPRQFRIKGGNAQFSIEDQWKQRGRGA